MGLPFTVRGGRSGLIPERSRRSQAHYAVVWVRNPMERQNEAAIQLRRARIAGKYGMLTLNGDGSYSYVTNSGALPAQAVAQDIFQYGISDGHGGTGSERHHS